MGQSGSQAAASTASSGPAASRGDQTDSGKARERDDRDGGGAEVVQTKPGSEVVKAKGEETGEEGTEGKGEGDTANGNQNGADPSDKKVGRSVGVETTEQLASVGRDDTPPKVVEDSSLEISKEQSELKSSNCEVGSDSCEGSNESAQPKVRRTSFYETIDANEILPYLIIGNLASAKNERFLSRKNVRFILNLTNEPVASEMQGIEYMSMLLEDDEEQDISCYLDDCIAFINRAKPEPGQASKRKKSRSSVSSTGAVLVHSYFGVSRTSAIVLPYLMKEKNWNLREAYDFLKERHPSAQPNDNFIVQLLRYEQELHSGKITMTLKDFYQQH